MLIQRCGSMAAAMALFCLSYEGIILAEQTVWVAPAVALMGVSAGVMAKIITAVMS